VDVITVTSRAAQRLGYVMMVDYSCKALAV
jgi:hypothetical protein